MVLERWLSRRSGLDPSTHMVAQSPAVPVLWEPITFLLPWAPDTHVIHRHAGKTLLHINTYKN